MRTLFNKKTDKFTLAGKLADDKLKFFIDVVPTPEAFISFDELKKELTEIPAQTLDEGVLKDVVEHLNRGETIEERRIAKGKEAKNGADGKLLILVKKLTGEIELKVDDKGFTKYNDLHLFDNIEKGKPVARVYPPKAGENGFDALGKELVAKPGKPFKPNIDKTLILKDSTDKHDDFQLLVADAEGYLGEDSGRLSIKDELVVDGDLDYRFGNLDFIGRVRVKGDVNPGFVIKAKTGIEITGSVTAATLICTAGDIHIKGGAFGGRGGRLISGAGISVAVARELDAEARGDIVIEKEAMDCDLHSYARVVMSKADLIGGKSYCVLGLEAKRVGNHAEKHTDVVLCSDVEASHEFGKISAEIDQHKKAIELLEMHLGPLVKNPSRVQLLKDPHKGKMQKLLAKLDEVRKSEKVLQGKKAEMLGQGHSNEGRKVNFLETLFPGVHVIAGDKVYVSKEEHKGPGTLKLNIEKGEFEFCEYSEIVVEKAEGSVL